MIKYPIEFSAKAKSQSGIDTNWQSESNGIRSSIAVPVEFEGPGNGLSPEDLFNQALVNCFVATFKVYAEKSKLEFESLQASSCLVVDLDDSKQPIMKTAKVIVQIIRPSNKEKAVLLANKAVRSGFILNSVKTNCQIEISIVE